MYRSVFFKIVQDVLVRLLVGTEVDAVGDDPEVVHPDVVVGEAAPVVVDLQAIPATSFGSWLSCNGTRPR